MIRPTRNVGVLLAVAVGLVLLSSIRWMHNGRAPSLDLTRPQQSDQDQAYRPQDEEQRHAKPTVITPLPAEQLKVMQTTVLAIQSTSISSSSAVGTPSTTSDDLAVQATSIVYPFTSGTEPEISSSSSEDLTVQITSIVSSSTSSTVWYEVKETTAKTDDLLVQITSIVSLSISSTIWDEKEKTTTVVSTPSITSQATAEEEPQTTTIPENWPPQQDQPPKSDDLLYPSPTTTQTPSTTPTPLTKAIVIGRLSSENTDWVTRDLPDWDPYIYTVDLPPNSTHPPTGLRTPTNKGRESLPYLTYIIDHYATLPDITVFLHAHRNGYPAAWHNDARDYDAVNMLHDLQLPFVQREGYANLRCRADPGCPAEIQPWRSPFDPERETEHVYPFVYGTFFNKTYTQYRSEIEVVATQCCAQFAVSRNQIRKHPRSEYIRWRQFILDTELSDALIGRVLEYMWHVIFGRGAVQCPEVRRCWCDVFGRCDDWAVRAGGG